MTQVITEPYQARVTDAEIDAAEAPPSDVPRVEWSEHMEHMRTDWIPGHHVSIIGMNGGGKSKLVVDGIAPLLVDETVIWFDVKGDDPELNKLKLRQIKTFPSKLTRRFRARNQEERANWYKFQAYEREPTRKMLGAAHASGGVSLVLDETRALTDHENSGHGVGLGLSGILDSMWLRDRTREVTIIALTQAPRYVPSAFYEQAWHIYIGSLLDRRARDRLSEIGGDTDAVEDAVISLKRYEFLYIGPLGEDGKRVMQIVKVPE